MEKGRGEDGEKAASKLYKFYAKGSMKDKIVEVEMSYTQFAEAITSLNIGEGIPVTITNINGDMAKLISRIIKQMDAGRPVDGIAGNIGQNGYMGKVVF